jgi:hypothetical protein
MVTEIEKKEYYSSGNKVIEQKFSDGSIAYTFTNNTEKIEKAIKKLAEKIGEVIEL